MLDTLLKVFPFFCTSAYLYICLSVHLLVCIVLVYIYTLDQELSEDISLDLNLWPWPCDSGWPRHVWDKVFANASFFVNSDQLILHHFVLLAESGLQHGHFSIFPKLVKAIASEQHGMLEISDWTIRVWPWKCETWLLDVIHDNNLFTVSFIHTCLLLSHISSFRAL